MIRNNIVTYAAILGGAFLVLLGLLGFFLPHGLGLHLNAVMNLVHLTSGCLALYFGLKSTSVEAARTFCTATGVLYCLAGLAGLVDALAIGSGAFALQSMGHLVHLIVGAGFVAAAMIQPLRTHIFSPL